MPVAYIELDETESLQPYKCLGGYRLRCGDFYVSLSKAAWVKLCDEIEKIKQEEATK